MLVVLKCGPALVLTVHIATYPNPSASLSQLLPFPLFLFNFIMQSRRPSPYDKKQGPSRKVSQRSIRGLDASTDVPLGTADTVSVYTLLLVD